MEQRFFGLKDLDIKGKKVILRTSYDVPLDSSKGVLDSKRVKDDSRIRDTIETISYLIRNSARIILEPGWLGRPKGEDPDLTMAPVALRLQEILKENGLLMHPVLLAPNCLDGSKPRSVYRNREEIKKIVDSVKEGQVVVLENVRYDAEANSNDQDFAKFIADLAGPKAVYVNEAEAQNHREEATVISTPLFVVQNGGKAAAGLKYEGVIKHIGGISQLLGEKGRGAFVFFLSGKKIETQVGITSKISVTHSLLDKMKKEDVLVVQGAVTYTFLAAQNYFVSIEKNRELIDSIIKECNEKAVKESERIKSEKMENSSQLIIEMQAAIQKEKSEKIKQIISVNDADIKKLIGGSFIEWKELGEQMAFAASVLSKAGKKGVIALLNEDHLITDKYPDKYGNLPEDAVIEVFEKAVGIPEGWLGVAPGPKSMQAICDRVVKSGLLILAGPIQIEDSRLEKNFSSNKKLLDSIKTAKEKGAVTIAAGGDTLGMINSIKGSGSFTVISNAGGATLELIEKDGKLPGIEALEESYKKFNN